MLKSKHVTVCTGRKGKKAAKKTVVENGGTRMVALRIDTVDLPRRYNDSVSVDVAKRTYCHV